VRFLRHADFPAKGITYGKAHIWKLRQLPEDDPRKFPEPIKGLGAEDVWTEPVIDEYVERRVTARREDETELSPIEELVKERGIDKEPKAQVAVG
jgi:hypothetical protein